MQGNERKRRTGGEWTHDCTALSWAKREMLCSASVVCMRSLCFVMFAPLLLPEKARPWELHPGTEPWAAQCSPNQHLPPVLLFAPAPQSTREARAGGGSSRDPGPLRSRSLARSAFLTLTEKAA